jgi:hypothetical protein
MCLMHDVFDVFDVLDVFGVFDVSDVFECPMGLMCLDAGPRCVSKGLDVFDAFDVFRCVSSMCPYVLRCV